MKHSRLVDAITQLQVQGLSSQVSSPSQQYTAHNPQTLSQLLWPNILLFFSPINIAKMWSMINTSHTTGPPISAHTCRLAPEKLTVARQELEHMLE